MLTSSAANQYLRPEYLTPLPTTLDAKKSPLALLAQTCSQIGADSSNSKSLLPPLDKPHKKADTPREKISPSIHHDNNNSSSVSQPISKSVASFKPYENSKEKDNDGRMSTGTAGSRSRTPVSKSSTPAANSLHVTNSPRTSPAVGRKTPASSNSAAGETRGVERSSPVSSKAAAFSSLITGEPVKELPLSSSFKPGSAAAAAAAAAAALPSSFLGYPGCHLPELAGLGLGLMSHFGKTSAGLNPYISYTRMKTAGGGETLVPVCRDPYCTGCQLNSQLLKSATAISGAGSTTSSSSSSSSSSGTCPSGCVQCDHQKNGSSAAAVLSATGLPHLIPGIGPYSSAASLSAAHLPYVCNWIAGDTYCGKRFSNSDELLQHLRSHTSLSDSLLSSAAALPTHPLLASHVAAMAALHRTYPTPPLSPLAAARYHPYSKPPLPPSLAGFPLHPHPALPPYFSPYSLYSRAANGMHP